MPDTTRRRAASDPLLAQPPEPTSTSTPDVAVVDRGSQVASLAELRARPVEAQHASGYYHTLREICQQPETWRRTAASIVQRRDTFGRLLQDARRDGSPGPILVTGSGSSFYAAEYLAWPLQGALRRPVLAVPAGQLLTDGLSHLPVDGPALMISLGRSGNSPESCAVIDLLLETEPSCRHLIITCNQQGRLAQRYQGDPRVLAVVLDDETCDRSLAMTSSLTNMLVAGRFLGVLDAPDSYISLVDRLAASGTALLLAQADVLAGVARGAIRSAVFLGSGSGYGAAREAALKMLEMTAGQIPTLAETYLSLRHGPMSAVHDGTAVVCFLSSDPVTRAYETDLIREMNHKELGLLKVIVGRGVARDLVREPDLVINVSDDHTLGDDDLPVLDVLVGQLIAFFSSLHMGCEPDRPSRNGAIARVVAPFDIHRRG